MLFDSSSESRVRAELSTGALLILFTVSGCFGPFRHVPTLRLASDTSFVLYQNRLAPNCVIYLPKGYEVVETEGPDFSVFHFEDDTAKVTNGYMGFAGYYDSFHASRFDPEPGEVRTGTIRSMVFSDTLTWEIYESKRRAWMQTIRGSHLWANAANRRTLLKWLDILGTMHCDRVE